MRLNINDKIFSNFSAINITLTFNAVASSFRFDALRDLLPSQLSYPLCEIYDDNDDLILTGEAVSYNYTTSAQPQLVILQGYSLPGILEDCNIPPKLYPLQSDNLSLKQIVDKILPTFNIEYIVDDLVLDDFNKKYFKSKPNISSTVKGYINNLASQRGIILSHDEKGRLVFTKINTDLLTPVTTFEEGNEGVMSIMQSVNGQVLHSEITVMKQASTQDSSSGQETVYNNLVKKYRPKVKISNSGSVFDLQKAARIELSNELSSLKFTIKTTKFVKPGQLIQLKAPSINIDNFIELFVEQIQMNITVQGKRYIVTCVLPEVYNLKDVGDIFI